MGRLGRQRGVAARWPGPPLTTEAPLTTVNNLRLSMAAEQVYASVEALACALQAQPAAFLPWHRHDPACTPTMAGFIWTAAGPRRVSVMLDTGATHCFIDAQLALTLRLPPSSARGPAAVTLATPDATRAVPPPVVV